MTCQMYGSHGSHLCKRGLEMKVLTRCCPMTLWTNAMNWSKLVSKVQTYFRCNSIGGWLFNYWMLQWFSLSWQICSFKYSRQIRKSQAKNGFMPCSMFKGLISTGGFITSSLVIYWIRHPSRQVTDAVQNLKGSLKDTYIPNDRIANWKGKEVPLVFVVSRFITKKMDEFQGLVRITSRELLTWFLTFFLFFFPFVIEDKDTPICLPHNETSTTLICTPE